MIEFDYKENIHSSIPIGENVKELIQYINILKITKFINEMRETAPAKVHEVIERQMRYNLRRNYSMPEFIEGLYKVKEQMNSVQIDTKTKDAFLTWLENKDKAVKQIPEIPMPAAVKPKLKRSETITKENIAFFCRIIQHANVLQRGDEDQPTFCQKVCKEFNLEYTDKVRQHFSDSPPDIKSTDNNFKKVNKLIFPTLTEAVRIKIDDHIKKNSKMYG